jgi:hypothetical protein
MTLLSDALISELLTMDKVVKNPWRQGNPV